MRQVVTEKYDAERIRAMRQAQRMAKHIVRLKKSRDTIGRFLKRADRLGDFLGPILLQLPPNWKADPERIGRSEGPPLGGRVSRSPLASRRGVHNPAELQCRSIHGMIDDHPRRITADWVYLRFHGDHYNGCYPHQFLGTPAAEIREYLADGLDVFAYFNNDAEGFAVPNAADLKRYILEAKKIQPTMLGICG